VNFDSLKKFLRAIHQRLQADTTGAVASYLPELASADPNWFGISAVSVHGETCNLGQCTQPFTIQSIAKPFVYGLVLEELGEQQVLQHIGVEPTGDAFNSLIEPDEISPTHYNPLVNSGAIVTSSLVPGGTVQERSRRLLSMFETYTGRPLEVDSAAFHSKKTTDHLNRALAHMMLHYGWIDGDVDSILDLYFQQCSVLATCEDLAMMAAALANGGCNPGSGAQALQPRYVKNVLSIMSTCGLYEFSGQWAFTVGIPAKSGLAGAIIGVIPQQLGIAVFSPPLDENRKSHRAVEVFKQLSQQFKLHQFDHAAISPRSIDFQPTKISQADLQLSLQDVYHKYLPCKTGRIYSSDPDLISATEDMFAISVATTLGDIHSVGDFDVSFLIQSISKVFAYGLALEDWGRLKVLEKVDVEPTGDAFDAIIKVEDMSKRPFNPMVNTGAIATTSLIKGNGPAHRLNRVLEMYRRYIGHRVFVDTPSFVAERMGGDRNWAISYLLRNFGMVKGDISQILDLYLQQCSVLITCRDLAMMAATLANNGTHPISGERAIHPQYVKDLLSVMFSCGMYDFAGGWVYQVGFPAKSGVNGAIIGVVPGRMGLAVFSPPLDEKGNSIRGIKVCRDLSDRFNLNILDQ